MSGELELAGEIVSRLRSGHRITRLLPWIGILLVVAGCMSVLLVHIRRVNAAIDTLEK